MTLADGIDATRNDGTLMLVNRASGAQGTATLVLDSGAVASGTVADLSDAEGETNLEINDTAHFSGNLIGLDQVSLDGGLWSFSGSQGVAALAVGAGGGTLDVGERSTFDTLLSGNGNLAKSGSGTLELTGNSAGFSGLMSVDDGALVVNGTLGGVMLVSSGARLGGIGTVGSTNVASGGTVAPGNSIGTLNVNGDITFDAGSIYEVELAGNGSSDRIIATGQAIINGGTVELITIDPQTSYQSGQSYIILAAANGTTGNFNQIVTDSLFLNVSLEDLLNGVGITIGVEENGGAVFTAAASTPNQFATAAALDTLVQSGASLSLYNSLLSLTSVAEAQSAFEQLSGEGHASVKSALIGESGHARDAVGGRLRQSFGEEDLAPTAEGDGPAIDYGMGVAGWGRAFGSWGSTDGDGNAADVDHDTGGFFVGLDGLVTDNLRLGAVAGYSRSDIDVAGRSFSADVDSYTLGLYAGTELSGFGINGGVTHTWHQIDTERSVAFAGFSDALSADYDAQTTQVFGEVGYKLFAADAVFEPFAGLAYVNLDTDGVRESGGAAALSSGGDTTDTTYSTLGLRASTGFSLGSMNARVNGSVAWQHAFGDDVPDATAAFAGSNGFTVSGVPIAEDAALVQAGFDVDIMENATIGLTYDGQCGDGTNQHGARLDLSVKF